MSYAARKLSFSEVPVIDLAPALAGERDGRKAVAASLAEACGRVGFFYVKNHQVPSSEITAIYQAARDFFDLPFEAKNEVAITKNPLYRGYLPVFTKGKDPKIKENLQEAFQIHPELPADDPRVLAGKKLHGSNPWPTAMPDLKPRMMRYYQQMWSLAQELLKLFALGLDMPETTFLKFFSEPMLMLRLLHYPPQRPDEIGDHIGTRAHTDSGAFTILAQDDTGGLEVCNIDGEWIRVPPIADSFVINIGEMMKVWTDGIFSATPHRVINRYGRERYSVPFFVTSDYDAVIEPMMRNPDQSNKAPEFATSLPRDRSSVCGEILSYLYWRIYPAYEGETADVA